MAHAGNEMLGHLSDSGRIELHRDESTESYKDEPDCIYLTESQYRCIAELGRDPQYVGRWSRLLTLPTWQALTQEEGRVFEWIVFSEYLGTLKFGLLAKEVEGGRELYQKVLSIWEHLMIGWTESQRKPIPHCLQTRMVFQHLKEGWFRVSLNSRAKTRYSTLPQPEAKQYLQGLASESFLFDRSRVGIRKAPMHPDAQYVLPIKHLPGCEQIDQEDDLQKTEGSLSVGFYEELKRTMAYVGRVMEEEEGEEVNWEVLREDMQSKRTPHSQLFYIIGQGLFKHIELFGESLLMPEGRQPSKQIARKRKRVAQQGRKRTVLGLVDLTPEFIDDSDSD